MYHVAIYIYITYLTASAMILQILINLQHLCYLIKFVNSDNPIHGSVLLIQVTTGGLIQTIPQAGFTLHVYNYDCRQAWEIWKTEQVRNPTRAMQDLLLSSQALLPSEPQDYLLRELWFHWLGYSSSV